MNNILDRFLEIANNEGITITKLETILGMSKGVLSRAIKKETDIQAKWISILVENYPRYSTEWLLTGKGEMLKTVEVDNAVVSDIEVLYQPKSKAVERFWNEQEIPLYEIAAGLKTIFTNQRQNIINFIKIPDLPKCDGAIYARGDSMYPLLKSGDIVIFKEVNDFNYFSFGEMYLVDYYLNNDDYLVIKYVQRSEVENHIKLVSYNTHHESLDIPIDSIRAIALIKASVRLNTLK